MIEKNNNIGKKNIEIYTYKIKNNKSEKKLFLKYDIL